MAGLFQPATPEQLRNREQDWVNSTKEKLLDRLKIDESHLNYQEILSLFNGIPISLLFDELAGNPSKQVVRKAVIDLDREKKVVPIMWGGNILTDFLKGHDILELILKLPLT